MEAETTVYENTPAQTVEQDKNRPKLTLNNSQPIFSSRPQFGGTASQDAGKTSNHTFAALGAENLGVVAVQRPTAEVRPGGMEDFNRAYLSYSNKSYDPALEGFSSYIQTNPSSSYADDALYWRGECYLAKGKLLKAIGEFERLATRYPKSEKVPSGLYRIGFVYDQLRDFKTATSYYFKVVEKYPGTDAARRASSRVAEIENRMQGGVIPTSVKR